MIMSDQTPEAAQLKVAENFLRSQIAVLEAERARIEVELAKTKNALAEMTRVATLAVPALANQPAPSEPETFKAEAPKNGDFAGLELTDAIFQYLLMQTQMRSIKEIWKALEKAGFKVVSGHPTRAVGEALRKRTHRRNDVFKAGNCWGARKNFTDTYIKRVTKKHAGMGGRSAEEHGVKTSEGIERRRARGEQVGARRKFDAEKVVKFKQLRAQGVKIGAACDAVGISRPLFQLYRNRIKVWKEGTLWPPPEPTREELARAELEDAQSQSSHLRVVK